MRPVTVAEMTRIDKDTIARIDKTSPHSDGTALMRVAADGVADIVRRIAHARRAKPHVFVVFGLGNNGMDAIFAGLQLARDGFAVTYFAAFSIADLKGIVKPYCKYSIADDLRYFADAAAWDAHDPAWLPPDALVIDGLLGTGLKQPPRDTAAAAIRWMQRAADTATLVSVDIPSGIDADTGDAAHCVRAHVTVCMGMPKRGMLRLETLPHLGRLALRPLGIDPVLLGPDEDENGDAVVTEYDVRRLLGKRDFAAHKGSFGHVCIIGGSPGYCGAPFLAAAGALKGGAGLVSLFVPDAIAHTLPQHAPEIMLHTLPGKTVSADALQTCGFDFAGKILVVGPGLSHTPATAEAVAWLLANANAAAFVLDADALNICAKDPSVLGPCHATRCHAPLILTPHPGEAARLLNTGTDDIQRDRKSALRRLVEISGAAVILKGAGTLVSAPGHGAHLVIGGNPGMASGGMGDALAGLAGALLGRGLDAFDAARAAAWEHARAGDEAAWAVGQNALTATDLLAHINLG